MFTLIVVYNSGYTRTFKHCVDFCIDSFGVVYKFFDCGLQFIEPEKIKEVRVVKEVEEL